MNKIGRGNRVGFVLGQEGVEPAIFRDVYSSGKWSIETGKTKTRYLVGVGYDIRRHLTLDAGVSVEEDLDLGGYVGASLNFQF